MARTMIKTESIKFVNNNNVTICTTIFSIPVLKEIGYNLNLSQYSNDNANIFYDSDGFILVEAIGVASYKDGDVNDKTTAKRVAETKAQRTGFKTISNIYCGYLNLLMNFESEIKKHLTNIVSSVTTIEQHLDKLIHNEYEKDKN